MRSDGVRSMTVTALRSSAASRAAQTRASLAARARSTPGRLTGLMVVAILLAIGFGAAAVTGVVQRSDLVGDVHDHSGPLTVQAQLLYRSLSDADATAASAFLQGGIEPVSLSRRYQRDIATASQALATTADSGGADAGAVSVLSAQLPVYTGLVETARTYNRQGAPLGAAYLREASALMRAKLLPAAHRLYRAETDWLDSDRGGAATFPYVAIPLGLLLLAALVLAQVYLRRRTNRVFNVGLLAATAAGVVAVLWLGVSWAALTSHLDTGRRTGSDELQLFAQSRLVALQARADESLTLVARGSGADFETDFRTRITELIGKDGSGGLLGRARADASGPLRTELNATIADVKAWNAAHGRVRALDDGGRYPQAVQLAIGSDPRGAAATFGALDTRLGHDIDDANTRFADQATAAAGTQTGAAAGLGVLAVLTVVGAAVGIQRRTAEYR